MEAVLRYLRADHPDVVVDAMCKGPETVRDRYDVPAIPLQWYINYQDRLHGVTAVMLKVLGKGIDVFRTANWVRQHDVVIVPGMGVLEATQPLRWWDMPYPMFLLAATGKLFGTKVALVCVGAHAINRRMTRRLYDAAAKLAYYRSYRDAGSRDAMRERGVNVALDNVYADLAFSLPALPCDAGDPQIVAVGLMNYRGSNDDRKQAQKLYAAYLQTMKSFVRWLIDDGRKVRLLVGDTNNSDDGALQEILADVRAYRPDLDADRVRAEPVSTFTDVMQAMAPVGSVVATRFHSVICALLLFKPTISLGYASKFTALMADMGLAEFCQHSSSLDVDRLIEQFTELERRQADLRRTITECNAEYRRLLNVQFSELSDKLLLAERPEQAEAIRA
jgi:polysaccharide pyruvyl transferase WcaK-like protein